MFSLLCGLVPGFRYPTARRTNPPWRLADALKAGGFLHGLLRLVAIFATRGHFDGFEIPRIDWTTDEGFDLDGDFRAQRLLEGFFLTALSVLLTPALKRASQSCSLTSRS